MKALVLMADARKLPLASGTVRVCVTSPPYFQQRDYGVEGQIGQEQSPDDYIEQMVAVFSEVRRVLRHDGTLWLNLGDSYASNAGGYDATGSSGTSSALSVGAQSAVPKNRRRVPASGMKAKDLMGIPWRVALALQDDGWYLRSEVIWHKLNPMPESVSDRPSRSHEHLFLLSKSPDYYYDGDAIAELAVTAGASAGYAGYSARAEAMGRAPSGNEKPGVRVFNKELRNKRTVWTLASDGFDGEHYAAMPQGLVVPCIQAGSAPGDVVFDPFTGAGTVAVTALRLGRSFVGTELKQEYIYLAQERIAGAVVGMGLATPEIKSKQSVQLGLLSLLSQDTSIADVDVPAVVDTNTPAVSVTTGQLGLFE